MRLKLTPSPQRQSSSPESGQPLSPESGQPLSPESGQPLNPESGFSLMEVVIALAILGIALSALIELGSISLRSTKRAEDYSLALLYARSSMEEAYITNTPQVGSETKRIGIFTIKRDIEEGTTQEEALDMIKAYLITITVEWPPTNRYTIRGTRIIREEG